MLASGSERTPLLVTRTAAREATRRDVALRTSFGKRRVE
jgi:hypothetical protein